MSYIDCYKHELVGLFAGLPVYHPLEDIPRPTGDTWAGAFGCTTGQLVLGGGQGEHLGVVLLRPDTAVAMFAYDSDDFERLEETGAVDAVTLRPVFDFAGWSVSDYHRFYERCTSRALPNPYVDEGRLPFEDWLAQSLGEFVYYAMPELAQPLVNALRERHKNRSHIRYNNVLLVPPGMPVYANGGNAFASLRTRRD